MAIWRRDPVCWAKDWLGVDLLGPPWDDPDQRAYQAEIAMSLVDNAMTYVVSGNGIGKDFTSSIIVPWWICTGSGICITTAPTDRQVREILWGEIRARARSARAPLGGRLYPAEPKWTMRDTWYARGYTATDENAFQGRHGRRVLAVGDEAAGIPEFVWPALLGCAVGSEDRVLLIGNPTCSPVHPFATGASSPDIPGKKHTIRVKSTETPNCRTGEDTIPGLMSKDGVERIYRMHGRNSAVANARVHAIFPQAGADSLIGYQHVGPARERWAQGVRSKPGDVCRAGGDVARFGDDLTSFAWVKGAEAHCDGADAKGQLSQPEVEAHFGLRSREIGAAGISIDGGAMGPGPIDYLRQNRASYNLHRDFYVYEVLFGSKAHDEEMYADRRTELWVTMRDFLGDSASIDIDDELAEELMSPTYTYVGRRYKLEPKKDTKKRLGKSPDRADALALAIAGHIGGNRSLVLAGDSGVYEPEDPDDPEDDERGDWDGMGPTV